MHPFSRRRSPLCADGFFCDGEEMFLRQEAGHLVLVVRENFGEVRVLGEAQSVAPVPVLPV